MVGPAHGRSLATSALAFAALAALPCAGRAQAQYTYPGVYVQELASSVEIDERPVTGERVAVRFRTEADGTAAAGGMWPATGTLRDCPRDASGAFDTWWRAPGAHRSITARLDPAGNTLVLAMPRTGRCRLEVPVPAEVAAAAAAAARAKSFLVQQGRTGQESGSGPVLVPAGAAPVGADAAPVPAGAPVERRIQAARADVVITARDGASLRVRVEIPAQTSRDESVRVVLRPAGHRTVRTDGVLRDCAAEPPQEQVSFTFQPIARWDARAGTIVFGDGRHGAGGCRVEIGVRGKEYTDEWSVAI